MLLAEATHRKKVDPQNMFLNKLEGFATFAPQTKLRVRKQKDESHVFFSVSGVAQYFFSRVPQRIVLPIGIGSLVAHLQSPVGGNSGAGAAPRKSTHRFRGEGGGKIQIP